MIRPPRTTFGCRTRGQAADAAVGRGMTDVLMALDNVVDDDAALRSIYAALDDSVLVAGPGRSTAAAGEAWAPAARPGSAAGTARTAGSAASRRRPALRALVAATATLTAGSVALAVVLLPGSRRTAVDTAYVVRRVDSALDTADPGAIARMTVTTSTTEIPDGSTVRTTAEEWSYGDQWRAVTYSPAGQLRYDEGFTSGSVYTLISYPSRTWADQNEPNGPPRLAPDPRGCQPVIAAFPLFPSGLPVIDFAAGSRPETVASALRAAVACGGLVVTGQQRVNGAEAIELTSRPGNPMSEKIWVSPGTYLPVRVVARSAPGAAALWQTATITWLKPTATNLASLTVLVPAGFRQVPFAAAATPFMQHISG